MTDHKPRLFHDDAEIVRIGEGLLDRTLPRPDWTHEAHLATTTYLLTRRPDIDIDKELPGFIRAYNESVGGVNSDSEGYHETITQVFIRTLRTSLARSPRHALEHHAEIDVLEHRVPGKQRVLLEHEGDVVRHRPAHGLAGDVHCAGGRRHQAADDVEQRGLAAAARPDQAEQLAARDVERGVAEREDRAGGALLAELVGDVLDPDRDLARHRIAIGCCWRPRSV